MELKKVKRQNTITHTLLSIMIVVTAFWQLSKVSILLSLKAKFSHPFRAAGNMISGFLKGGGNSQVLERPGSTSNKLLKAPPTPPVNIPELPHVNLPSMLLNVVEH
uniref:Protein DDI1 2 n=2 Tax=Anthurium amnicola TaxID=1678845 RepID=A0A1D1YBL5_9ARAE